VIKEVRAHFTMEFVDEYFPQPKKGRFEEVAVDGDVETIPPTECFTTHAREGIEQHVVDKNSSSDENVERNDRSDRSDRMDVNVMETIVLQDEIIPMHVRYPFEDKNRFVRFITNSLLRRFNNNAAKSLFALSISKVFVKHIEHQHLSPICRCCLDAEITTLVPKTGNLYKGEISKAVGNDVYFIVVCSVFSIFLPVEDVGRLRDKNVFLGDEVTVKLTNLLVMQNELFGIGNVV